MRPERRGGGLLLLVDPRYTAYQEKTEADNEFTLCVKIIMSDGSHMYLVVFYAPPNQEQRAYRWLQEDLRLLNYLYRELPIIIMGDFNHSPNS